MDYLSIKVHRVTTFNQNGWLKPYVDINTDIRKKPNNDFEKIFLSWWTMQFSEKLWKMSESIEILSCHSRRKKELFTIKTKLSYSKVSHRKFISNRNGKKKSNKKREILINKPVCLGFSIL